MAPGGFIPAADERRRDILPMACTSELTRPVRLETLKTHQPPGFTGTTLETPHVGRPPYATEPIARVVWQGLLSESQAGTGQGA